MTQELINSLTEDIKRQTNLFYNVDVNDKTVKDFIDTYYLNEDNKEHLFDNEGNYYFETSEREDFMIYLNEIGVIKLKDS
jgi:hypothetical protein